MVGVKLGSGKNYIWYVNWLRENCILTLSSIQSISMYDCCKMEEMWRHCGICLICVCSCGAKNFHQIHVQLISQWQSKTNMSFFTSLKIQVKIKWTEELIKIHKGKFFLFIKCFNYSPTTIYKIHILQKWSHWTNLH